MEAIFCLGAAASAPSFPAGPNSRRRATRLPGSAVPVACALSPAYPSRGAAAAPLPWGTKPAVRSSTRTAAGGADGSPGRLDNCSKQPGGHDKKDGGGKQQLPPPSLPNEDALTAILPLEKRFQLLEHLNNLNLALTKENGVVTTSPVLSKDWLSSDEKLNAGFALSLVYFKQKKYAEAKQVLEKLLRHEASSDTSRVPFLVATLMATLLALEIYLPKGKTT